MAAYNIDLGEVKAALNAFVAHSGDASNAVASINTNFVEATKNEWNTPAAARFIDGFTFKLNDYISQFNSKYQNDVNLFVDGVNALSTPEQAIHVEYIEIQPLRSLQRSWTEQDTHFNIPKSDYGDFTQTNLTENMSSFHDHLETMQADIDRAVNNGLDASFCTSLRADLDTLKKSAIDVSNEYNSKAAQSAVEEDSLVQQAQSNT